MRSLTRMLAVMLIGQVIAQAQELSGPNSLFSPCADALRTREFAPLRGAIPEGLRESAGCLRLTNHEYLLFSMPYGPGNPFVYCDLRAAAPVCKGEPNYFYSFQIKRQFTGANGKQYMLWYTWQMKRGVQSDGYGIFSLVPRSIDPRGFAIYTLPGGYLFKGEGEGADPCHQLERAEVKEITGYELTGEGTSEVELRFIERIVNCASKQETTRLLRYRPKSGKFEPLD